MESLVTETYSDLRPVVIPHHKGRKRMHLELKETMSRCVTKRGLVGHNMMDTQCIIFIYVLSVWGLNGHSFIDVFNLPSIHCRMGTDIKQKVMDSLKTVWGMASTITGQFRVSKWR